MVSTGEEKVGEKKRRWVKEKKLLRSLKDWRFVMLEMVYKVIGDVLYFVWAV